MAEETQVCSEIPVVKLDAEDKVDSVKKKNGDLPPVEKEVKKEEDEADGEFIKVEKESLDVKDGSQRAQAVSANDEKPSMVERSFSNSSRELLEAQEKIKELELELERAVGALKHSESENTKTKDEFLLTKEKLEESRKKNEELEHGNKKLQEQIIEAEEKHSSQLNTLQEALQGQEIKHKELIEVKDAFEGISLELESSRKSMKELEDELQSSATEAKKFEELHRQSGSHAESETQRALEFKRLLEVAKQSAKEMEDQMACLQEEVKSLCEKIADNQKVEEALKSSTTELSETKEELALSKSQLLEVEQRLSAKEALESELTQELELNKVSESKAKEDVFALESLLTATKEDYEAKIAEFSAALKEAEQEKTQLSGQMQEFEEKTSQLESALNQSSSQNLKLEKELKIASEKCVEHEDRAKMNHQRSLELEDLCQTSHSKVEETGKKLNEMELLLETEKYRIQELEEQISTVEKKCMATEADSKMYSDKVSELSSELEAFQARASSLEVALQIASEKEKELTARLTLAADEKKRLEDASSSSSEKLAEAENLVAVLRNELNEMQERLVSIENDLKAVGLRESEVMLKLKSAEEQLEKQEKLLEQATTRNSELESIHDSLKKDSEIKIQEAMANFTSRDTEVKSLFEKLKILEDQVKRYEQQVAEAEVKLASFETSNDELKKLILAAEEKAANSLSENELLVQTNSQLKAKIDELQELLNSAVSGKEAMGHQLASHVSTISEITDKHSRAIELHSATEAQMVQVEAQLQEAIQKHNQKDVEMKNLNEKLNEFEGLAKLHEEKALEASAVAESQKHELDETLLKLKQLESIVDELQTKSGHFERESGGLAEANLKLTQELASYESKLSDLDAKLSGTLFEKDEVVAQLHNSKKAIDDLTQQLADEGQRLQSQISSLMEENNLLNEGYQNAKMELQSMIVQLEEQLKEKKANEEALISHVEKLKAEVAEKLALETCLEQLEKKLSMTEAHLKEEVAKIQSAAAGREVELNMKLEDHANKLQDRDMLNDQVQQLQKELELAQTTVAEQKEAHSQKELELKKSLDEFEAKNKEFILLEKQVKELEQKLQLAEAKSSEKGEGSITMEQKDGVEIKSRDIGSTISTPSKRKSKKRVEGSSGQGSSSSEIHPPTAEASHALNFKFVLGVALVSIILGIILGKRY